MSATKPVTKEEMEDFAVKLTDSCDTHERWLSVVRYGAGFLLENQPLLVEIIIREAARESERRGPHYTTSDAARQIFDELGLKFVTA